MNRLQRIASPRVAAAARRSHNAAMKAWFALSLAVLAVLVGVGASTPATVASKAGEPTVVLHRCTDAKGKITWQDDPCPKGSEDVVREMIRPQDPPKPTRKPRPAKPVVLAPEPEPPPALRELIPPPAIYRCTSYDGDERYSESYDPNPRCEPIVVYYPYPNYINPSQGLSCRWVEDSCVRLSDREACAHFRKKKIEAASLLQRAFSDTIEYRKSELARLEQIVRDSCD
jgi:hypothetical protein